MVSTTETLSKQIDVFPNPTTNTLSVSFNSLSGNTTIQLLNVQGQSLMEVNDIEMGNGFTELNVSTISNGVYFLRMIVENKVVTKRVVVQR